MSRRFHSIYRDKRNEPAKPVIEVNRIRVSPPKLYDSSVGAIALSAISICSSLCASLAAVSNKHRSTCSSSVSPPGTMVIEFWHTGQTDRGPPVALCRPSRSSRTDFENSFVRAARVRRCRWRFLITLSASMMRTSREGRAFGEEKLLRALTAAVRLLLGL